MKKILCISLVAVLLLSGCGRHGEDEDNMVIVDNGSDSISYDFCIAAVGDVVLSQKIQCTYMQQNEQEVTFPMTGRVVDKVYVKEGEQVKKGDLLAELTVGDLQRRIEDLEYKIARNEIQLKYAKLNEELEVSQTWVNYAYNNMYDEESRDDILDATRTNSRYQKEDYEDALEVDRQNLAKLKQELTHCSMRAEMDGIVYKMVKDLEGMTSTEGIKVMTIVDNSQCLFETEYPEYAHCFKEGEAVTMNVTIGSPSGEYKLVPYQIENWGAVQQFSVADGPTTTGIQVGTKGNIDFVVDSRKQVIFLPSSAVNTADDKHYVYVVDEDNMRQIRWVETGLEGNDTVEIISGLEEGEKVIRK